MRYLSAAFYKIFRIIYSSYGLNADGFFSVSEPLYTSAAESEMSDSELRLRAILSGADWPVTDGGKPVLPALSHETLNNEYPSLAPSLFNILHQVGDNIRKRGS
jgi:hypothetical protein